MDKKNLLSKLIAVFNSEEVTNEETSLNFVDVKTSEGRILRVSEMAVEKEVKEITEAGEVDLEDGEYTLEDGIVLTIQAGLIKEISEAEEEVTEEEVVETEMSEEVVEEVIENEIENEIATEEVIESDLEVENLISNIQSLIEEVKSLKEGFSSLKEENEGLKLEVEKFSKAPSVEPTKVKVDFKKEISKNDSLMYTILNSKK